MFTPGFFASGLRRQIRNREVSAQEKIGTLFCVDAQKILDDDNTLAGSDFVKNGTIFGARIFVRRRRGMKLEGENFDDFVAALSSAKMFAKPSFCSKVGRSHAMKTVGERDDARIRAITCLTIIFALALNGCLPPAPSPTAAQIVLLWLKHPKRSSDRAQLVRAAQSLRKFPGVLRVDTARSIPAGVFATRQDFDLAVRITFRDRAALQRYEKDPRHELMRQYLEPLIRHYEIYTLDGR